MMTKILPALLVAGLSLGGSAFAGTTAATTATTTTTATAPAPVKVAAVSAPADVSGAIKKINAKRLYIVLDNGFRYHLAAGFDLSGLKVGEKVTVTYTMKGRFHEASAVKAM